MILFISLALYITFFLHTKYDKAYQFRKRYKQENESLGIKHRNNSKPSATNITNKQTLTPLNKAVSAAKTTVSPTTGTTEPLHLKLEREEKARKKSVDAYLKSHEAMCKSDWANRTLAPGLKPLCNCTPSTLLGHWPVDINPVPLNKTMALNKEVKDGGHWEPANCTARYKIAIIIPFRDRHAHLSTLLANLHPKLRGQHLNYTIIVVEQNEPEVFNKASIMNVGFVYAMEIHQPDCVIFHDVDMIPQDGRHFYTCRPHPLHLGAFHSRHAYRLIYGRIFGGVTSFSSSVFKKINGFSNRYSGWGGEDDDMSARVRENGFRIWRDPVPVGGFTAILHPRDKGNIQRRRGAMLRRLYRDRPSKYDGLNTLKYFLLKTEKYPLYTWLLADVLNDDTKVGFALNSV